MPEQLMKHSLSCGTPGSEEQMYSYSVGRLPGRKQVALYWISGSVLMPVAYFRDEAEAKRFARFLECLAVAR